VKMIERCLMHELLMLFIVRIVVYDGIILELQQCPFWRERSRSRQHYRHAEALAAENLIGLEVADADRL
jgi:hypothetical protein